MKLAMELGQAELSVLVLKDKGLAEERFEESKQARLSGSKYTDDAM